MVGTRVTSHARGSGEHGQERPRGRSDVAPGMPLGERMHLDSADDPVLIGTFSEPVSNLAYLPICPP